jgi:hypothetical protein
MKEEAGEDARGDRQSAAERFPKTEIYYSLGCEKIPTVQHGDDLAAREQFFEVIALAQFLIVEVAFPEGGVATRSSDWPKRSMGILMR